VNLVRAFRNEMLRSDSSVPVAHRPKLVTHQFGSSPAVGVYERPARSVTRFCSYNSACINIFIHRSRRCDHNE